MVDADEVVKEFLVESRENLDQLDRDFVALEAAPSDGERIAAIFRTIHTIKGTAGFLGFHNLEELAHSGESLLGSIRDGSLRLSQEITSGLLALVDRIRGLLVSVESAGHDGVEKHEALIARLTALRTEAPKPPVAAAQAEWQQVPPARPALEPALEAAKEPTPVTAIEPVRLTAAAPSPSLPPPESSRPEPVGAITSDLNVRVDVGLLDKLMNLVGELVLTRNQLIQFGTRLEDPAFLGASQRLNLITTELQEHVMKTRMQPIGNVWSKLPRVVRDLAVTCGKQLRIEMIGKDTELDRTILEAIKDPLTHIVRNAVDHGFESPDVRVAGGKPRTGTLILRAFHEGGQVNVEVSDDGGGLDVEAIQKKALERGVSTADRLSRMSEFELMQLVFMPGFSTAKQVTNVSGRGVGMDVVKTNIERIGGTVDIVSRPKIGTTIKIKIPLTLAIVPALIVTSDRQHYAIPQVSLLELVRLEVDETKTGIEWIRGGAFYRLRGRLLPLVFLRQALSPGTNPRDVETAAANIVILQTEEIQFGLVVDEVHDTEEIVVKPLGKELKNVSVFAGATIMGDGRVALILDATGLAEHARVLPQLRDRHEAETRRKAQQEVAATRVGHGQAEALLLFAVGADTGMAIPLSMVARLEEFPSRQIERVGSRQVIQYRGHILPLIDLSGLAATPVDASDRNDSTHVIVHVRDQRSVGFVVSGILDVVESGYRLDRSTERPGTLGSAVVQGRVMELLDTERLISIQEPSFFQPGAP